MNAHNLNRRTSGCQRLTGRSLRPAVVKHFSPSSRRAARCGDAAGDFLGRYADCVSLSRSGAVLLCFDGVVHLGDLPVQAFARHITEQLTADEIRPVIAGMRGFLESKTELIPAGVDLSGAEDGYRAVEVLARTAGLDRAAIATARQASRLDLAASAWAVDPAVGLDVLLTEIRATTRVVLLTEPGDPAARPVLESIEVTVDDIVDTATGPAIALVRQETGATPDRLLIIGTRWTDQLAPAQEAGCATALIDRYGRGRGAPTFRSPDLAGLLDPVRGWLEQWQSDPGD